MTWRGHFWHYTNVIMYNESNPIVADSGLVTRTKGDEVFLNILLIRKGDMAFYDGNGRFIDAGIVFQISKKELNDNSFTITNMKTFVIIDGTTYRIMSVNDYTYVRQTQLMECKAVKILNAD